MKKQALILLMFSIFLLIGCTNDKKTTKNIIDIVREQTNINIPQDANLIEKYETSLFLHGRLPKYYIFQFDKEPEEFLLNNTFQEIKNDVFEKNITNKLESENKKYNLKIPKESLITFDELYLYKYQEDDYCLIYYPNDYKLIVLIFSK